MNDETLFLVGPELREAAIDLLTDGFLDDPYYTILLECPADERTQILRRTFSHCVDICLDRGWVVGRKEASTGRLIAVSLWFDYNALRDEAPEEFAFVFEAFPSSKASRLAECIDRIVGADSEYLYLLSVVVDPAFRRRRIAAEMVERMIRCNPRYNVFSDLSNEEFARGLLQLGFRHEATCEGCHILCYRTTMYERIDVLLQAEQINVVVPSGCVSFVADAEQIGKVRLDGLRKVVDSPYFSRSLFSPGDEGDVVSMDRMQFDRWRQTVNPLLCEESVVATDRGDAIVYIREDGGSGGFLCFTERFRQHIAEHSYEWNRIADIYTLVPMAYDNENSLAAHGAERFAAVRWLLHALDFRTRYESGILVEGCEEHRSFASRIRRCALEFVTIQLYCESEISFDGQRSSDREIGEPVQALLTVSYDRLTSCAVLHMTLLCAGVFVTQYLDSVSRGQLSVLTDEGRMNLYDYVEMRYGLHKRGSAKNYTTLHERREQLDNRFLASVLYGETYYERGESLGNVIDPQIVGQLAHDHGLAQYDYASAYFHTNSVVHIVSSVECIRDRIVAESVTLFYIEMVLYEESAIEIMNHDVVGFLTHVERFRPGALIRRINRLLNAHLKSIAFWNLNLNYPSSTRSLNIVRSAFGIPAKRSEVELNKRQLISLSQTRESYFTYIESRVLTVLGVLLTLLSIFDFVLDVRKRMLIPVALFAVAVLLLLLWRRFSGLDRE